jgi:hypothetical protein
MPNGREYYALEKAPGTFLIRVKPQRNSSKTCRHHNFKRQLANGITAGRW